MSIMKVYEKIRIYIEENGLNHTTIAEKAGIEKIEFNEILEGKRVLDSDDFRAICFVLRVYPEMFLDVSFT